MARGLALTVRLLRTIQAERTLRTRADLQAAENVRLLETLRKRQRVLEAMARIQRAISIASRCRGSWRRSSGRPASCSARTPPGCCCWILRTRAG